MNKTLLFRLVVLVTAMMCALGVRAQEAYACYTLDNTTLTFYYDDDRNIRPGTTYFLNTDNNDAGCNTDGSVTINDVTVLIDYLLSGQWP